VESQPKFLNCPAYDDQQDLNRCGLPAEVKRRFIMRSTDGPIECAMIRCPVGHFFNAPIEFLSLEKQPDTARERASAEAWHEALRRKSDGVSVQRTHQASRGLWVALPGRQ
jgi:hypothetical protein